MIVWLNAAALVSAIAVALPILVHLLLRRRAARVPFPTVRFIGSTDDAAVRLRRPSDLLLLAVRVAIIVCAALALGRPMLLTDARKEQWRQRLARAIVVDTSASVPAEAAVEAAEAESRGAAVVRRFDAGELPAALRRATAWLGRTDAGLREIVVVSDFQAGTMADVHVQEIPASIGVRAIAIETASIAVTFDGGGVLHRRGTLTQRVSADADRTSIVLRPAPPAAPFAIAGADPRAAEKIRKAVAEAGAVAPERPLTITVDAPPDSLAAAAAVQAALNGQRDPRQWSDREPARIPPHVLSSWRREPKPLDTGGFTPDAGSDGRWLWLAAIVLLVVEWIVRRDRPAGQDARYAHAA